MSTATIDRRRQSVGLLHAGLLAAVVLGGLVFASELDYAKVGLGSSTGVNVYRRVLLVPLWLLPIGFVLLRSHLLPRVVARAPMAWMVAWLAWGILSAAWSIVPMETLQVSCALAAGWLFVVWFVSMYGWTRFALVTAAACLGFIVVGLAMLSVLPREESFEGSRLALVAYTATNLGRIAAICAVLGSGLIRLRGRVATLGVVCVVVGSAVLILTQSRAVFVGFLLAAAYGSARHLIPRHAVAAVSVAIVLAVGSSLIWPDSVSDAASRDADAADVTTVTGRTTIWSVALDEIVERPILGHGTGSSQTIYDEAARSGKIAWRAFTAHNLFLSVLLTHGLVGLVLFTGGIVAYVRAAVARPSPWRDAAMLVLLANGLTEALVHTLGLSTLVFAACFTARSNESSRR